MDTYNTCTKNLVGIAQFINNIYSDIVALSQGPVC
jgi:hypothetical protein